MQPARAEVEEATVGTGVEAFWCLEDVNVCFFLPQTIFIYLFGLAIHFHVDGIQIYISCSLFAFIDAVTNLIVISLSLNSFIKNQLQQNQNLSYLLPSNGCFLQN